MPDQVIESWPWFLEMRELIAERPNIIPTGLGNNTSGIDMSTYLPGGQDSDVGFTSLDTDAALGVQSDNDIKSQSVTPNYDQSDRATSDDDTKQPPPKKIKSGNKAAKRTEKKTAARPGMSKPITTQKGSVSKGAKNVLDRFAETAKMEEVTIQKELDLVMG